MDKITIVGPGSIGGFLAAAFSLSGHEVTCLTSHHSAKVLRDNGYSIESPMLGKHRIKPTITETLNTPCDIAFICTKSYSLSQAVSHIKPGCLDNALVLPLLNGIEHIEFLRERLPHSRIVPAVIGHIEVKRLDTTTIVHTNKCAVIEAYAQPDDVQRLRDTITATGITFTLHDTESSVLWEKLIRLNALACTTAVSGLSIGEIRSDSTWRNILTETVNETCAVAAAEGYETTTDCVMAKIDSLPAHISTSMARDHHSGQQTEMDSLAGAISRLGLKHGIPTPTIDKHLYHITECSTQDN